MMSPSDVSSSSSLAQRAVARLPLSSRPAVVSGNVREDRRKQTHKEGTMHAPSWWNLYWKFCLHLPVVCHYTHTHTQPFYGPFSGTTQVSQCQKKSSGLTVQGETSDNSGGHHSIRTNQQPILMPDALPATTLPIYPGLGRALAYSVADWVMIVVQQRYSVINVL